MIESKESITPANSKKTNFFKKNPILTFFILTFVIGAIGYGLWVISSYGFIIFTPLYVYLGGFSPLIGALITSLLSYGKKGLKYNFGQSTLNFKHAIKWIIIALLIPWGIQFGSIGIYILFGGIIEPSSFYWMIFIPGIITYSIAALGEEFGWRTFLLPHLQNRYNAFFSNLILGLIWAFWHWPHFILKDSTMLELYGSFFTFILSVFLSSLIYAWIYNRAKGNALTVIFLHGAENAMLGVFPLNLFYYTLFIKILIVIILLSVFRQDFFTKDKIISFNGIQELMNEKIKRKP